MTGNKHELVEAFIFRATQLLMTHKDENVLFPVAGLLYHDFAILAACGGHLGRKTGGIFIDIAIPGYDAALEANARNGKNEAAILHATARTKLALILLLNDFYSERGTKYEHRLIVTNHAKGVLRLQTIENDVIETLADAEKWSEWLIAANDEFFAFAAYLFDNPSKPYATR